MVNVLNRREVLINNQGQCLAVQGESHNPTLEESRDAKNRTKGQQVIGYEGFHAEGFLGQTIKRYLDYHESGSASARATKWLESQYNKLFYPERVVKGTGKDLRKDDYPRIKHFATCILMYRGSDAPPQLQADVIRQCQEKYDIQRPTDSELSGYPLVRVQGLENEIPLNENCQPDHLASIALIHPRDRLMARNSHEMVRNYRSKNNLAVVGANHVPGISRILQKEYGYRPANPKECQN